ncbi:hypothetical protein PSTT_04528 [Puccinia striiformis]|uniref:Uncharacterized protein n=1 Tax=Puccinia striiformis TaxID=27350 RepID=A0A2S4VSC8_9BASI|nr:hypothetical protein PSTT_04528 [Puccinia striiformis]
MVESVEEIVTSFRSGDPAKISDQDYQDIAQKAVSRLHQRVNEHGKRASPIYTGHDDDSAPYENQTLHQLRRIIFPKLKKNLNLLLIAMEPSNFQCDKKSESINSFMDILTDIDTILGELADAMSRIKKNLNFHERALVEDSKIQPVTHFQHSQTRGKVDGFLDHAFSDVLVACDALLSDSCFISPSSENSSVILEWEDLATYIKKATAKIDVMTKWFENSMLNSAREEWRYFLKLIENSLLHLWNSRIQDSGGSLSRSTDSNPLILDEPSTCMDVNRFKLLLKVLHNTDYSLSRFDRVITQREMRVNWQVAEDKYVTIELVGGFIRTSRILWEYYDSMVVKDDPRVFANLMGSPVCKWSWRELAAGLDLSNDEVVHDDEWQDRWELANRTELDQKPDGELDK